MSDFSDIRAELADMFAAADEHVEVMRYCTLRCRHCTWEAPSWGCVPKMEGHLLEMHGIDNIDGKKLWMSAKLHAEYEREIEQLKAASPSDERVAELVEAAYREGLRAGTYVSTGGGIQRMWERSEAKATLAAGKGGGT